jgi:hypothetical protein
MISSTPSNRLPKKMTSTNPADAQSKALVKSKNLAGHLLVFEGPIFVADTPRSMVF